MFVRSFTINFQRSISVVLLMLCAPALNAEQKPYAPETIDGVTTVSAEQVIDMILANPDLIVIDSRKKTEYLKGHIEGATNILNTLLKAEDLERLSSGKNDAILFYCNGSRCLRSSDSINKAKAWGYTNLVWFRGGWKEWTEKRLPVITE